MCAQPKVVVKIESEEDMLVLQVSVFFFGVSVCVCGCFWFFEAMWCNIDLFFVFFFLICNLFFVAYSCY